MSESEWKVTQSCPTLCDPIWTVAHQASPSMKFSRQEYWNGLPFPSPRYHLDLGTEPRSPALQADALLSEPPGNLQISWIPIYYRVGLWRRLSAEELMLLKCGVGRRLLRVPWTARKSNQSILKEISPGISLEGMRLKLKLQYFGHLMWRVDSLEKTLMLGGIGAGGEGDDRGWDGWMASRTRWTWVWVNSGSWWWTGRPGVLRIHGVAKSRTRLSYWTELNYELCS